MAEGHWPIIVTERGKWLTISAREALLRAPSLGAMKGNAQVQRRLIQTSLELERQTQEQHAAIFWQSLESESKL
jgi:hypothetical protein